MNKIGKLVFAFFFILMSITSGFLIYEYHFFKKKVEQLDSLKDEYTTYVLTLKRMILEYDKSKETQDSEYLDEKKKQLAQMNNSSSDDYDSLNDVFPVVNRESDYLQRSALEFAKLHDLEDAVKKMYESEQWFLSSRPLQSKKTTRKRVRKKVTKSTPIIPRNEELEQSAESYISELKTKKVKKSKKEPIFKWPIEKSQFWLSSLFGPRKKANGTWGFHRGIDMAAVKGTPVNAANTGIVIEARYVSGYGNTIVIWHNKKFKTRYAHLSKILVKVGQRVDQGTCIGRVGDTGFVRGRKDASHLHFEVYVFGKQVNPIYFLYN